MILLPLVATISLLSAAGDPRANPCANGSFEELAPNGFPVAWGPIGRAELCGDAHSGKRALRLVRTTEPPNVETGVNSHNMTRLRGGIDFYYKAVAAKDAEFHIYAFPILAEGVEGGAARAAFAVPKQHVGDGQWHHGRLKYDFTKNPVIKTVIFGARIQGTSGELLLDDFSYVERVGPLLRVGTIRIEEDPKQPGERGTVSAPVENAGDEPAKDVRVAIDVPKGLKAGLAELRLGDVASDGKVVARWTLDGPRFGESRVKITATSGPAKAESDLRIAPQVVVRSWGPTSPVFLVGEPISVECELANIGNAIARKPQATIELEGKRVSTSAERIAPGQTLAMRANLPPEKTHRSLLTLDAEWQFDDPSGVVGPFSATLSAARFSKVPPPSGTLKAVVADDYRILENEHLRVAFPVGHFVGNLPKRDLLKQGASPTSNKLRCWSDIPVGELCVKAASGWRRVAWLPQLAQYVFKVGAGDQIIDEFSAASRARAEITPGRAARLVFADEDDESPVALRVTLELRPGAKAIALRYEFDPRKRESLAYFLGPSLHVLHRDEAVFPGVEWLVGHELSSGSLDIAGGHPDRVRPVVHPNWITIPAIGIHGPDGTVGLLWDVRQKWDGTRDRPGVYFASPDQPRNHRSHRMALFVPNPPEFIKPNVWPDGPPELSTLESQKQYHLEPGKKLTLEALIYADGEGADALSAIDQWAKIYGFPKPAPLPHGSYEKEIEFSMQAYLKSLWVPEEQKWWTSKGGGMLSSKDRPRAFVADLLVGEILSPDAGIRRQCRARAEEVLKLIGGPPRLDAQRFAGRMDSSLADPSPAAGLLMSRGDDGAWRFNADQVGTGPFVGLDYHELGPNNAVEVGLCAAKATAILRYARITGDWAAYRQMLKTLELMERFRVPRAAQVWEVPVHSPDILAAAEAAEAYIEAYRFSRDPRWLRDAVAWARRGLPFVYFWSDPQKPFLVGASIPVFGASWMQASWFGRPVQWNGLRYAEAILKLAEYDQTYPWRQIATAITHSAILQQDTKGPNVALWPDSIGAVKGDKAGWVFAPQMILANVLKLLGRDPDLATVILGEGEKRLHVSAAARLTDAAWDGSTLTLRAAYPRGEQGVVVVFNTAKPQAVAVDGKALAEREDLESGSEPGWRYDEGVACLSIRIVRDGPSAVRVEGARFRQVTRLARLADRIAFEFNDSLEGWIAMHQVADLAVRDGTLAGKMTGPDPYLGRSMLRVRGDDCPVIVLRMRVTAGAGGQCFWMTEASPGFTEDKSIRLNVQPDGEFHEYRLEVGKHRAWSGQTITGLRIDPSDGAPGGEFAIDYVRAAGRK